MGCDRDGDRAPRPCRQGIFDQVGRARARARHGHRERRRVGTAGVNCDAFDSDVPGEVVEREVLGRRRRGFLSGERKQIVRELGEPLGISFQVGHQRRACCNCDVSQMRHVSRAACAVKGVPCSSVGRVGEETGARRPRAQFEPLQHRVQQVVASLRPRPVSSGPGAGAGHRRCGRSTAAARLADAQAAGQKGLPRIRSATAGAADCRRHASAATMRAHAACEPCRRRHSSTLRRAPAPPPATSASVEPSRPEVDRRRSRP